MGAANKDYYQLLGVERDANEKSIKEAYRELARLYHPDSNFYTEIIEDSLSGDAIEKFKLITAAYNTLIDRNRRREYDQTLLAGTIPDWDDEEGQSGFTASGAHFTKQKPATFGKFGHTNPVGQEDEAELSSVADLITKRNICRRILSVFGF